MQIIYSALCFAQMIIPDTQHYGRRTLSDGAESKMEKESKNNQEEEARENNKN